MNNLKNLISTEFKKEIAQSVQFLGHSLFADNFLEDIDKICSLLEKNKDINIIYPNEEKRKIFDNLNPTKTLKMLWFIANATDDLEIFKWTCDGLKWKKGIENYSAILCQEEYIKKFKPENISNYLIKEKYEDKQLLSVFDKISPLLLYCVEGKDKKTQHQLVRRRTFKSNCDETYNFLKQTNDTELFNKVMKKQMTSFSISPSNIILKKGNDEIENKVLSYFYENMDKTNMSSDIATLRKHNLNNIAAYVTAFPLQKSLSESLSTRENKNKKLKI